MCDTHTIPNDIQDHLQALARDGLRIIAMAFRSLPMTTEGAQQIQLTQEQSEEQPLTFLGLLALSNPLKTDTNGL